MNNEAVENEMDDRHLTILPKIETMLGSQVINIILLT